MAAVGERFQGSRRQPKTGHGERNHPEDSPVRHVTRARENQKEKAERKQNSKMSVTVRKRRDQHLRDKGAHQHLRPILAHK
jgi:hypothetical protein